VPAVLVHGVPETDAVWDSLRPRLSRGDVATLRLPGFGVARPDGFGATKEDYVEWLAAELATFDEPVDLVGHDWGGGLVVRLVSLHPELVRSWVTDAAALGSADFQWHDFAKIWQTPGEGEDFFAGQLAATQEERAGVYELFGVGHDESMIMATWPDQTMVDCILSLYRSAVDVGTEWSPDFHDIAPPGCVLICSDDAFLDESSARAAAQRAGAQVIELSGIGHWWMLQDPQAGATALEQFWATLG
jgi:pimeloyl-ACP methyl ester carboxylesterase